MSALLDRALLASFAGFGFAGAAAVTIAQGVADPNALSIERIVGGGILVTVAVLIVRWSRQMSTEVRATLDQTISILEREREAWTTERAAIRSELAEAQALLREERNLRISLERAGITDRRTPGEEQRPTDGA